MVLIKSMNYSGLIYFDQLQMEKENADSIKKIKVKFTSLRK